MDEPESDPLYIWSKVRPSPEQLEKLKAAKQASGVTALVKPARAIPGCERVISFEGRPPFYCEWAEPKGYDDPNLPKMIAWVLTGEGGRPHTGLEWMQAVIGPEVREVA